MRGIAEFNFPAFEDATAQLRALGYKVISPAEQDLRRGFDPSGLTGHEDLSSLGFDLRDALVSDLTFVARCDAICLLPGWEGSKGASAELALAEALGLQNGSLEDFLEADGWEPQTEHEFLQGLVREVWPPKQILAFHEEALATFDRFCGNDDEIRVTSSTGGQKGQKLARFELFPTRPLWAVAELYGYGAGKYQEARNWEKGHEWSLSYAALQRHANLFWSCEDDDPESGLPHLAAVVFHALSLMEYARTHPEFDDRPGQ